MLDRVAADGVTRRTVNRHREVIVAIQLRPATRFSVIAGGSPRTRPRRRQSAERTAPAGVEVFTVEQVEALARAAEAGTWRVARPYETAKIAEVLRDEDRQLGELRRVAAYTGLRRGELIALRWRDVRWSERVLIVERALSGTVERTTKGRRIRYVPLADQPLAALDRLARRRKRESRG